MPLDAPLLNESLAAEILDVALHARAVTLISQPCEVVGWNDAKLAYLDEGLYFGLPQGIFAVAGTIDCSRALICILRLLEFLILAAVRSAEPIVISRGLFPASAVTR